MTGPVEARARPSIGVIVPAMDRSESLRHLLPSLLAQDYPRFTAYVVDNCSVDGLESIVGEFQTDTLRVLRRPRPRYFSLSETRNCGVRYTFSDLLFFLDADLSFQDAGHLSRIVAQYLGDPTINFQWFANWRRHCGYEELVPGRTISPSAAFRKVYCHCLGSPLLVERRVFQALGGYNEALRNWGYEDTDLCGRLELSGFGRIEMESIVAAPHDDELRVVNLEVKDTALSWQQNRIQSDTSIATAGTVSRAVPLPGRCAWIEIDGTRYQGDSAPQQDWIIRAGPDPD